jgi:hypothetical protein
MQALGRRYVYYINQTYRRTGTLHTITQSTRNQRVRVLEIYTRATLT